MKRLAVLALLLAACGGDDPQPMTVETTAAAQSSAPSTTSGPRPTTVPPSFPEIDTEWFDQTILSDTIGRGAVDVQAAVVRNGIVVHQFTSSSPRSSAEVTVKSRFRIASISKIPTAMAVMRLVEDGVMALDERPLDEVAARMGVTLADPRMKDITVYQLLSHTSGFDTMSDLFFDSPEKNTDVVIEQALGSPLVGDPGRAFVYSNLNYVLLGRLAGWRMGMPWFAAVQRLVLDPLGIEDWLVGTTSGHEDGDALHTSKEGRNYMELLEGAGAWLGRASDVALILDALNEGSFFRSPATSRLMRQPSSAGPPNEDWTYGLGLRIFPSGLWGHSGTLEAAHDMVVSLPDGTVVAVLVNGEEPSDSDSLIETIVRALEPRPDPAPSTTAGP